MLEMTARSTRFTQRMFGDVCYFGQAEKELEYTVELDKEPLIIPVATVFQ